MSTKFTTKSLRALRKALSLSEPQCPQCLSGKKSRVNVFIKS